MYSVEEIKQGIKNPVSIFRECNRLYYTRLNKNPYNVSGEGIFDRDWDNLIILDACRYDEFCRIHDLPGDTDYLISQGSTSSEFIRSNFSGKEYYDTVYVSANGWFGMLKDEIDADVYNFELILKEDENQVTSSPKSVTESVIEQHEEHPNKRLIAHYIQPHHPYIGETGCKVFQPRGRDLGDTIQKHGDGIPDLNATLRRAYRENLRIVLEEVKDLFEVLDGKTVVTADHGEMLGERSKPIPIREYGHPGATYVPELVKVPWHTYTSGSRRDIQENDPVELSSQDKSQIEEHLEELGYKI